MLRGTKWMKWHTCYLNFYAIASTIQWKDIGYSHRKHVVSYNLYNTNLIQGNGKVLQNWRGEVTNTRYVHWHSHVSERDIQNLSRISNNGLWNSSIDIHYSNPLRNGKVHFCFHPWQISYNINYYCMLNANFLMNFESFVDHQSSVNVNEDHVIVSVMICGRCALRYFFLLLKIFSDCYSKICCMELVFIIHHERN